ncbi:rCG36148, partial [Rattus norvegicus]
MTWRRGHLLGWVL